MDGGYQNPIKVINGAITVTTPSEKTLRIREMKRERQRIYDEYWRWFNSTCIHDCECEDSAACCAICSACDCLQFEEWLDVRCNADEEFRICLDNLKFLEKHTETTRKNIY